MNLRDLHMLKCATYSESVIPPLPTSNISRSFQAPGWAFDTMKEALFIILTIEHYVFFISWLLEVSG